MDSTASARPDDDEARRRGSTDCIYFLASPLTCKKGSECEYRHSDAARMNPRDCWYWFNGNCTNPKCSFRHPPFDNQLGAPPTPRAAQLSAPHVPVPAQAQGTPIVPSIGTGTAKQGVPCYYFQQGMCAKGVKCAFLHVPQSAGNPAPPPLQKVFTSAFHPNPQLKNSWTKPDPLSQQKTASGTLDKPKISAHDYKPIQKQNLTRRIDHSSRIYNKHSNSHVQSGSAKHYQPQPSVEDDIAGNSLEVRETSAGSSIHVGSIGYDSEQSFKGNHKSYLGTSGEKRAGMRQTHGSHEPERPYRNSSSDTLLSDKRIPLKEPSNVTAGSLDLRHRLLKQRKLNNPTSTQAPDRHHAYVDDRQHRGNEQASHEGVTRSRLHGRIKLPGEASFDRLGSHSEREKDRGPRARLSPLKHTDLRGKLHERLKARSNADSPGNAKSLVKKSSDGEDAGSLNFSGPKSLAELKASKVLRSTGEDAISNTAPFIGLPHRTSETVGSKNSSESLPFESPKPLSLILKRKREATPADCGSIQQQEEEHARLAGESHKLQSLERDPVEEDMVTNGEDEDALHTEYDMEYDENFDGSAMEDAGKELEEHENFDGNGVEDAGKELGEHENSDGNGVEDAGKELGEHENSDGNGVEDAVKELEEPQDEDYDYDAADINADEDNDYQEYEDDDDLEDDDDFARRVGVMIS